MKLATAALLAAGVFAIYSAPAVAAVVITQPPKQPTCTNCDVPNNPSTSPGDPFNPFLPDPDPEDGTTPDPDKTPDDGDKDPGNPDDPKNPDNPDDPKNPDNPDDPNNPNNPDDPKNPGKGSKDQASAELRKCLARLDSLPSVSASVIGKFAQPHQVTLTPICEVTSLTDVQPVLVEGGNVAGLEPALRANELIRGKLGQTAYKTRDVVGIDFDAKGNAILLVHRHRG